MALNYASAYEIKCDYSKTDSWTELSEIYYCDVKNSVSNPSEGVTHVSGNHLRNKDNCKVLGFWVDKKEMKIFPKNLENEFENLIAIGFDSTGMREIHKEDLEPFGEDLEFFRLSRCDIEFLEKDLFIHNPNLKVVGLHYNKIKYIHENIFASLTSMTNLWLSNNYCINADGQNRKTSVEVVSKAKEQCFISNMVCTRVAKYSGCGNN